MGEFPRPSTFVRESLRMLPETPSACLGKAGHQTRVRWEALEELPARGDWPPGATSDDTEQLLLVAQYLVETNGQVNEQDFLARLSKALPTMRGAGPTTRAAVRRFLATGELHATGGSSIGAAMRALPFGWATPVAAAAHRQELTIRLSQTTHGAPEAIISAGLVAEMAAWAIEQHPIGAVSRPGLAKLNAWHGSTRCVLLSCGRCSRRPAEAGGRPSRS